MTAQIGDQFRYKNAEFEITAQRPHLQFNPLDYGIIPEAACTACWRGFWCVYDISPDGIFLSDLYINSAVDYYPEICGVRPEKRAEDDFLSYMGHQLYKGLNIKIPYTGKILIGDNFLRLFYIHNGFQCPWGYRKLIELVFEDGKLVAANNHSRIAAKIRRKRIAEDYEMPNLFKQIIKPCRKINVWWYHDIDDIER